MRARTLDTLFEHYLVTHEAHLSTTQFSRLTQSQPIRVQFSCNKCVLAFDIFPPLFTSIREHDSRLCYLTVKRALNHKHVCFDEQDLDWMVLDLDLFRLQLLCAASSSLYLSLSSPSDRIRFTFVCAFERCINYYCCTFISVVSGFYVEAALRGCVLFLTSCTRGGYSFPDGCRTIFIDRSCVCYCASKDTASEETGVDSIEHALARIEIEADFFGRFLAHDL